MNFWQKSKEFFLDLVFPKFCVGCQKQGEWVCQACQEQVIKVVTQVCPDCQKMSEKGQYCPRCRKKHKLSGIIVSAYYEEGPIKEAVHNLKYNNVTELADFLGSFMSMVFKSHRLMSKKDILVTAVPMHYLRRAQRGYNQAEILANIVANNLKLQKNFKIIKKIRKTKSQVEFSGENRRKNLKNSFIIDKNAIKNRTVLLVDDVTTTGATLEECAKVLREAGAKEVWGLVIARG